MHVLHTRVRGYTIYLCSILHITYLHICDTPIKVYAMPCHLLTLLYGSASLPRIFSMYKCDVPPVPGCCPKHHRFNCVRNAMRSCTRKGRRRGTGWKTPMWCFRTMSWRIAIPNLSLDAFSRHVRTCSCELDRHFI